jgi:hypothetical protein
MTAIPPRTPCSCLGQCGRHTGPCEVRHECSLRTGSGRLGRWRVLYPTDAGPMCGPCIDALKRLKREDAEKMAKETNPQMGLFEVER